LGVEQFGEFAVDGKQAIDRPKRAQHPADVQ
jgi:hypothetical protein